MKAKFLRVGSAVIFSLYLAFLGSFGIQKVEGNSSIFLNQAQLNGSDIDLDDFGITQRQFESGHSNDEVKDSSDSFNGSFSNFFCPSTNHWIRLALFFSFKLSFKDLSVLYHNLRI